ncbi:UNKNOWN [Stylonychia lemnae]|uniref:Uncharacterized protein n=1 Tax=Stylonychia lemnae TaxID=5949 RepID=A0A078B055_STYLE|nr:UNKNOWN [Stylonychia lemnae]|eukprot:CDW86438.1 UNKNOWN [Stylonychia lemnae]
MIVEKTNEQESVSKKLDYPMLDIEITYQEQSIRLPQLKQYIPQDILERELRIHQYLDQNHIFLQDVKSTIQEYNRRACKSPAVFLELKKIRENRPKQSYNSSSNLVQPSFLMKRIQKKNQQALSEASTPYADSVELSNKCSFSDLSQKSTSNFGQMIADMSNLKKSLFAPHHPHLFLQIQKQDTSDKANDMNQCQNNQQSSKNIDQDAIFN